MIIGWTIRMPKNVMIAKALSRRGAGNTIVGFVVKYFVPVVPPTLSKDHASAMMAWFAFVTYA